MELERNHDLHSRFGHLLQPIRDLTKNWDVDVASQLEEYLEEIESITITFNDGATKMNFAEAALLIQGSTCVYSKKVEYLYSLVYQTLDLIASKRKLAQASSMDAEGRDKDTSFAQRKDLEEFLILDDMTEATNIDMVEGRRERTGKTPSTIPRTPASLIPVMDSERAASTPLLSRTGELLGSKLDFKMNTSLLHPSGALLLEPVTRVVLEVKMANRAEPVPITFDTPADKVKALLTPGAATNLPEDGADIADSAFPADGPGDDDFGCYSDDDVAPADDYPCHVTSPAKNTAMESAGLRRSKRVRLKEEAKMEDPWKLLDPHDPVTTSDSNKPFKRGVTHRLLASLTKSTSRKRKKAPITPSEPLAQFLLKSFYCCSSLFPKNPLKAPLSSEFEGLYWSELKARTQQKRRENVVLSRLHKEAAVKLEQQAAEEQVEDDEGTADYQPLAPDDDYSDDERGDVAPPVDGFDAMEARFEGVFQADNMDMGGAWGGAELYQGVEPMAIDESRRCGGSGEGDVVHSYEDLVRNYVESTMAGVLTYAQETALSKRVREWEEKIKPRLLLEERNSAFDIHAYGASVIEEFKKRKCGPKEGNLQFRDVVENKEPFEISRTFAATLQLANDYSVEICCQGSGESAVNTMALTLLDSNLAHKAVSNYRAPSLNDIMHGTTSKKQKK